MIIEFDKDYLRELYTEGRTNDKKHRYQPEVIRGYQKAVFVLSSANTITDLFRNNALNYEVLKGDKKGISSVRINRQYRLELTVRDVMNEQIVTVCRLLDISNHNKKNLRTARATTVHPDTSGRNTERRVRITWNVAKEICGCNWYFLFRA